MKLLSHLVCNDRFAILTHKTLPVSHFSFFVCFFFGSGGFGNLHQQSFIFPPFLLCLNSNAYPSFVRSEGTPQIWRRQNEKQMCWADGRFENESRQVALGKVSGIPTPALKLSTSWLRLVGCGWVFFPPFFSFLLRHLYSTDR